MNHLALLVFNQMRALLLFLLLSICSCVAVVQASTTEESVSLTITDSEGQTLPFSPILPMRKDSFASNYHCFLIKVRA